MQHVSEQKRFHWKMLKGRVLSDSGFAGTTRLGLQRYSRILHEQDSADVEVLYWKRRMQNVDREVHVVEVEADDVVQDFRLQKRD